MCENVENVEKCGKMCKNVRKCAGDPFSIYYSDDISVLVRIADIVLSSTRKKTSPPTFVCGLVTVINTNIFK